jgi:hypothetical protein
VIELNGQQMSACGVYLWNNVWPMHFIDSKSIDTRSFWLLLWVYDRFILEFVAVFISVILMCKCAMNTTNVSNVDGCNTCGRNKNSRQSAGPQTNWLLHGKNEVWATQSSLSHLP